MVVSIHRTLPPDTFSHGMMQEVLEVSHTALQLRGNMFLWTWALGPNGKRRIFTQWNLGSFIPARRTYFFTFLFISTTSFVMILSFLKQKASSDFLLGSHLTAPNQSNKENGSQHQQKNVPWNFFSRNGAAFPRSIFTKLWKHRATCFYEPGNWGLMAKDVYTHCLGLRVADLNLPEKHVG